MKWLSLFLITLLAPLQVFAAVVYDNGGKWADCSISTATCTETFVIGSISNPFLYCDNISYGPDPGTISMTYNGVSMTKVGSTITSGTAVYYAIFYLKAPATGSHSVVSTHSNNSPHYLHCASFSGADQSSPVDGTQTVNFSTATSLNFSVSTTTANIIVVGAASRDGRTFTATAPAWKIAGAFDSQATLGSATTSTASFTTSSDPLGGFAFGVKAVAAASTNAWIHDF